MVRCRRRPGALGVEVDQKRPIGLGAEVDSKAISAADALDLAAPLPRQLAETATKRTSSCWNTAGASGSTRQTAALLRIVATAFRPGYGSCR